ncbi:MULTISPECIES: FecCD family ABC transporter permease [Mammaliicoccus]|uniref:Enterobactin ABC transporter permease n=1 Tax=Mammaliicoccus vitulinus TaxID=71237 RepID=A0A2T4PQS5_9STAP|nr:MULTISPECIES: iron ABC transporter permease [Mammaliicoccus]HAL09151.1 enterobactin ABC transporter permease [Staphylococcus sp.]PTI28239.1 enterobactin ABC transporter permease [Mammaliicoccus vitulinus]PTI69328.1 enterobactin ABC transporter permease [Mammaliicoccus vitulinus]PTI89511.1 enterobactin ABC transporter permease [Mammaliicoccus vitulinus]QQT15281.1 iron ABC transporter permease [Mammaliicoccus vitulinus]
MTKSAKISGLIALWFLILLFAITISLFVGSTGVTWKIDNQLDWTIFYKLRVPRTLLALIAGMGLVISGQIYQTILNNPLADSFTLGLASGATFGSALAVFIGVSVWFVPLFSIFFSLLTLIVIVFITETMVKTFHVATMILSGIFIGAFFNSALYILLLLKPDKVNSMVSYMFGSVSSAEKLTVEITGGVTLICILILFGMSHFIKMIQLGDDKAITLGVNVRLISWCCLLIAAIMTAVIISFTGIIGFIGMIVPQVVRRVYKVPISIQMILNLLIGGSLLLIADTVGRVILSPIQIPVGIVLSIIAIPIMMYLMITEQRKKENH